MSAYAIIDPREAKRIGAVAALTTSDKDGERMAALATLHRLLGKHDLRLGEVVERGLCPPVVVHHAYRPEPAKAPVSHQRDAAECLAWPNLLNDWEKTFLASIVGRRTISDRQKDALGGVLAKVRRLRPQGGEF